MRQSHIRSFLNCATPAPYSTVITPASPMRCQGSPSTMASSCARLSVSVGAAFLGQDVIAHVAVPNLPRPMVARLAAGHPLSAKLARGQNVWLNWQADQAVILKD